MREIEQKSLMAAELGRDTSGLKPESNHKPSFSHTSYSQLFQVKETAVKLVQWSGRTPGHKGEPSVLR